MLGKIKLWSYLCKVCIFLPTLFYKIIETCAVVMKNMINTISKKLHTLVKENTHHAVIKKGRNAVSCALKRSHFSTYHCVFFPTVVRILVGRLDLCFLTHTKKYMTPIQAYALIFQKHVKMSVYIRHVLKFQKTV